MEHEPVVFSPEEEMANNLQIPLERIRLLIEKHNMPVEDEAWAEWMVDDGNLELIISEKRKAFYEKFGVTNEVCPDDESPAADDSLHIQPHISSALPKLT